MPTPTRLVLDTNIMIDMLHFGNRHTQPLQMAIDKGQTALIAPKVGSYAF